jgi:hypothetical protein
MHHNPEQQKSAYDRSVTRSRSDVSTGAVEPGVGYYKLLFRGFRPARLGRLKKLTCVSQCQLHDGQQPGREASVTVTWPSRRLTQSTRADAAIRNSHLHKLDAGDDTRLKRQTPSEYNRWRCGSPARGDSTNDLIAVIGAVAARKVN